MAGRSRGRSSFRNVTSARRRTGWSIGPCTADSPVSVSASFSAVVSVEATQVITLARIRGMYELYLTSSVSSVGDGFRGAMGMCRVQEEQIAVGITAIPLPLTDEDWDGWLWHEYWHLHSPTTAFDGAAAVFTRGVIDSKAMRKFSPSESLAWVIEGFENGVATMEFSMCSRALEMLP